MQSDLRERGSIRQTIESAVRVAEGWLSVLIEKSRLGIASLLTLALCSVGGLVLVTNLIVEDTIRIETTTRITVPQPASTGASKQVRLPAAEDRSRTEDANGRIASADVLLLPLDRYGESVRDRVNARTNATEAAYQRSLVELEQAASKFTAGIASVDGTSAAALTDALRSQRERGSALVAAGDERRAFLSRYSIASDSIYARVKAAINGSWKIFGRLIARQSLMQLNTDLDTLRRRAADLGNGESLDEATRLAMQSAEAALQNDLKQNERAFRASPGNAWFETMQTEVASLSVLRESIHRNTHQINLQSQDFAAHAVALIRLTPRTFASTAPVSRPSPVHASMPTSAAPIVPSVRTQSVRTSPTDETPRHTLVAWISAAILTLLICVCAATVLGVVGPVRRLQRATGRLAAGDPAVSVPRGGLRELDSLASAFNAMADEVRQSRRRAREYQGTLENEVFERTRQLQTLAEQDPLTGLPNRRELFTLLNAAIDRARTGGHLVGVFFIDIDNFKNINDSLGHAFGDRVLVSLSQRLHAVARPVGFATRLGGDEFTVVLDHATNIEEIRAAGLQMVEAFQSPLLVDGRDLRVSISVGASVYPQHEQEPEALLKAADAALFRAKTLGRSQLSVFTPDLLKDAAAKFTTEQGLRRAIERGEFELVFQPEVCAESLETVLVEALIRWRTPDGHLLLPGEFLAVAEESGLIVEISDWVLKSAVETAAFWFHGPWPEARVAVNVTNRQLVDPNFIEGLCQLLQFHRLPPKCIELELTESVLQTGPATIEALKSLRAHGIAIALDDFGTGYSSLASIEQLPLSRIKLDRTLIARIDSSSRSAAIAQAIIGMCQVLGLEITAEGIERSEQFSMLLGQRGTYLQGYLLARPVARDELIAELVTAAKRSQQLLVESQLSHNRNVVRLSVPQPAASPMDLPQAAAENYRR